MSPDLISRELGIDLKCDRSQNFIPGRLLDKENFDIQDLLNYENESRCQKLKSAVPVSVW